MAITIKDGNEKEIERKKGMERRRKGWRGKEGRGEGGGRKR